MLVARITVIEANEKLRGENKLKKPAKITEQMRELKKAQGAPDTLKKAI